MEIDRSALLQEFARESAENLDAIETGLMGLESRPADDGTLEAIFRMAHTFKGNAFVCGLSELSRFAHTLEDALERLRERKLKVSPELITVLLRSVDALRAAVPRAVAGQDGPYPAHAVFATWLEQESQGSVDGAAPDEDSTGVMAAQALDPWSERRRTLRVGIDKLDKMLTLAGEIAIAQGRLTRMLEEGAERSLLLDAHGDAQRLNLELQEQVLHARMVPVSTAFNPQVRVVRDLSQQNGKQARVALEGGEVEVDTAIIENIRDPLMHMVRNAVDHAIELPEVRERAGKPATGTVTLSACRDAGHIVIQVSDDGAGLDRERIAARAKELGLVEDASQLPDAELFDFIFEPGFSTAAKLTQLSGRGVGMDVVKRNVQMLHGTVSVSSERGKGTTFALRLPLSMAIIEGFSVGVGEETYVLPLDAVEECVELPHEHRRTREESGVLNVRGKPLPYIRLAHVFDVAGDSHSRESVVVIRHNGERSGFAVDELHGKCQTVIKPLDKVFKAVPGVSGSAILGTGRVALILDVPGLVRETLARIHARSMLAEVAG